MASRICRSLTAFSFDASSRKTQRIEAALRNRIRVKAVSRHLPKQEVR
jgi:hypothetical protein